MWNAESKMRNDADWSKCQTTWPLTFCVLPQWCHNRQSGKIRTSNAKNKNTEAKMHLVPDSRLSRPTRNLFMP